MDKRMSDLRPRQKKLTAQKLHLSSSVYLNAIYVQKTSCNYTYNQNFHQLEAVKKSLQPAMKTQDTHLDTRYPVLQPLTQQKLSSISSPYMHVYLP